MKTTLPVSRCNKKCSGCAHFNDGTLSNAIDISKPALNTLFSRPASRNQCYPSVKVRTSMSKKSKI